MENSLSVIRSQINKSWLNLHEIRNLQMSVSSLFKIYDQKSIDIISTTFESILKIKLENFQRTDNHYKWTTGVSPVTNKSYTVIYVIEGSMTAQNNELIFQRPHSTDKYQEIVESKLKILIS